eukprot:1361230-Rhodomonas_salina.7
MASDRRWQLPAGLLSSSAWLLCPRPHSPPPGSTTPHISTGTHKTKHVLQSRKPRPSPFTLGLVRAVEISGCRMYGNGGLASSCCR